MKTILNVVGAIIIKDNLIFCTRRGASKSLPFKWEFPGGKIEPNESHENALVREIKEELNSEIKVLNHYMTVEYEYETFHIVLHTYICELITGNLELTEHVEKKWVTKQELLTLDFALADLPIVEKLSNE